jgi:hypothetical protein
VRILLITLVPHVPTALGGKVEELAGAVVNKRVSVAIHE